MTSISTTSTELNTLYGDGYFTEIDVHFADFMTRLDGRDNRALTLAAALLSQSAGSGHICLDLNTLEPVIAMASGDNHAPVITPGARDWVLQLRSSPVIGGPGEQAPMILDESGRLYLYRYWRYEQDLIAAITLRASNNAVEPEILRSTPVKDAFNRLFPRDGTADTIDWQKVAALVALMKRFCVISGGPGTGKTHTVARILALLIESAGDTRFRALLTAPTGKAAAKLGEAMKTVIRSLTCSAAVKERIPVDAQTIHRMLTPIPGTPYFRHDKNNPLPFDAVIVDEASMVDLALLSKLAVALPPRARLVLIGDKDQLASVEAGAVLGDICNRGNQQRFSAFFCHTARPIIGPGLNSCGTEKTSGVQDCVVSLVKSYRFDDRGGIGSLSRAVNRGDTDEAMRLMASGTESGISWRSVSTSRDLYRALEETVTQGYRDYLSVSDPLEALKRFNRFRILCAVNRGPWGVKEINRWVEVALHRKNLIKPKYDRYSERWYTGRPILVTANDYGLGVFNGDVGLAAPAPTEDTNQLFAHFADPEGRVRQIPASRLSQVETVYAMTIHKSQGSEFDRVHVILPDIDSAVMTRELIYTAVTRARSSVTVWGHRQMLEKALSRRITRRSGLREALWGRDPE